MNGDQEKVNKSQEMENTIEMIDLTAEDDDVDVQVTLLMENST